MKNPRLPTKELKLRMIVRQHLLNERVALLEQQLQNPSAGKHTSLYNNYEPEPFDPERRSIRFLELGTGSIRNFAKEGNDDELQTVVGVEEKESSNNASDLAERISLIEMRLDEFEETKEPV